LLQVSRNANAFRIDRHHGKAFDFVPNVNRAFAHQRNVFVVVLHNDVNALALQLYEIGLHGFDGIGAGGFKSLCVFGVDDFLG
jgi:hypothetical protein